MEDWPSFLAGCGFATLLALGACVGGPGGERGELADRAAGPGGVDGHGVSAGSSAASGGGASGPPFQLDAPTEVGDVTAGGGPAGAAAVSPRSQDEAIATGGRYRSSAPAASTGESEGALGANGRGRAGGGGERGADDPAIVGGGAGALLTMEQRGGRAENHVHSADPSASGAGGGLHSTGAPTAASSDAASCAPLPVTVSTASRCFVDPGSGTTRLFVMDLVTPDTTVERGQVLVDGDGRIACVGCHCADADPSATRVICPDAVMAPGLINAHDHGGWMNGEPYDADDFVDRDGVPLVADLGTRFEHRNDWRAAGNERLPKIAAPGGGAPLAAKTWGEVRFALGGATTTFASTRLTGILRDVDDKSLGDDRTRNVPGHVFATYETFPLGSTTQADRGCGTYTLTGPRGDYPWVPHVAEGIDATARNEFLCLTGLVPGGFDVLDARTAIIHGMALLPRDMAYLAAVGAKVVWSPRSNVALYGDTARVVEMDRLGVTLGLGTDWVPSGSMNMLRELACADSLNRDYFGGYFGDHALVAMATAGAAAALGFDDSLGRLAPGLMGDLVVFARRGRTPHRAVLDADEGDVVLVLRGGLPTVGDADVVAALEPDCDEIGDVCGVPKRACVLRDTGRPWSDVVAEVGDAPYPLFGCGSPPGEVTCVPCRTLPEDAVGLQSPLYAGQSVQGDADGDGIPDADDTCPGHFNPIRPLDDGREADADGDGRGDACDPCPLAPDTLDCAGDLDGDGVPDLDDLCPYDAASTTEDRDGDGWGDACDTCPDAPNPGTVACPGPPRTIQELWRLGAGIDATLDGVCVIAVKAPERLWVQDPFSTSSGESAGLFVYSSVTPLAAAVGDRVRVTGQTDYYADTFELRYPTLTVLEPRAPECDTDSLAVTVDPSAIVPGAETELRYRYMLVRLVDVTVTESGGHDAPLVVTGGLAITSYLAGFDPAAYPVGTRLAAILGVVDYFARSQLMPRSAGDLLVEQMAAR